MSRLVVGLVRRFKRGIHEEIFHQCDHHRTVSLFFRISLSITLLMCSRAMANSCDPVDYRSRMPPIRNQANFSWCYAFSAADLLSFETGTTISALGVGIQFQRHFAWSVSQMGVRGRIAAVVWSYGAERMSGTYDFGRGGSLVGALHAAIGRGPLCQESELPTIHHTLLPDGQTRDRSSRARLEELRTLIQTQRPDQRRGILAPGTEICNQADATARALFPSVEVDDFRQVARSLEAGSDPLGEIYDMACQRRVHPGDLRISMAVRRDDGENLLEALDEQLNRSPAGITYDTTFFRNPDATTAPRRNHASTIVGRQRNPQTGECEYLLRNSWGSSCEGYHSSLRCEAGHVWLPSSVIKRMSSEISGLQGPR